MPLPQTSAATAEDYWALPEGARAELIDGELWGLASPSRVHQEIVSVLTRRLGNFIEEHGGPCKVYPAPFAVNLSGDESTLVEPDVSVVCDRSRLSERGCEGAPDLVAEVVSPSNPGMDYVTKLAPCRDAGVREYWVVDPQRARALVYDFGEGPLLAEHSLAEPVASAAVLPGFEADLSGVVAGM